MTVVAAPNASTELLQHLIRLQCVNTGQPDSGDETRAAELLRAVVDVPGVEVQSFGPLANRQSLVARLPGTDPTAPTLLLLGHTDVVPVTPDDWQHDPFGGELIGGWVWGRGAIDMLCVTASMAVAFAELAKRRLALPSPSRDLIDPFWTDAGFLLALERFGYDVTDEQKPVIAFQRRFRHDLIDGMIDGECRAKLLALLLPRPQ